MSYCQKLYSHRQLGSVHPDQEVRQGHGEDGDDDGKVGDDRPDLGREEGGGPEGLQVPRDEEGADEEEHAHQERVRVVVAAHGLQARHQDLLVLVRKELQAKTGL